MKKVVHKKDEIEMKSEIEKHNIDTKKTSLYTA